ncbi:MAG: prevent-host-death protein [Spirochaetaceae bacterium]|jgi:hypothetical protein|nr:prevent-host-death protein [Spirochaetaceae bacterium]
MQVYTYSEARQKFDDVLNWSFKDDVIIKRRDGNQFKIIPITTAAKKPARKSPLDVPGIDCGITRKEILEVIHACRSHEPE